MEDNEIKEFIKIQHKINRQHNINFSILVIYILLITTTLLILLLSRNGII